VRERHFPRVCRSCRAPMARQEDACWRCGTEWASEDAPTTTLKVIPGGARAEPAIAVAARAASDAWRAADRWANEGGSYAAEATVRAT
jgi:predicted amidophosphoribosyltransferase